MHQRHPLRSILIILIAVLLVGCGGKTKTVEAPKPESPSLDQVRRHAAQALDANLSSDQRQRARESALVALLEFLRTTPSLSTARADWERELTPGAGPMIRVFETDRVRVFSMVLPVPGIVPPGERVAVQFRQSNGAPEAFEVQTLPGGQVVVAGTVQQTGQQHLTLGFSLLRGGGYVASYLRDTKTGEFRPNPTVLKGVPARVGELTMDLRGNFLLVSSPSPEPWRPQIEAKEGLVRLFVHADIALELKDGRFTIVDERNFNAFQGFLTALDTKVDKAARDEAWAKSTRKLPAYLQEMESWMDDLGSKLPPGATVSRDQVANMAARIISIPAPVTTGDASFTVVQHRSGGGLPSAQVVKIPGVVESFRLVTRQGLPGLVILSNVVAPPATTGATAASGRKVLTLMRQTAGSSWEPAPDWFGFLPEGTGWKLERSANSPHLMIDPAGGVSLVGQPPTVVLKAGSPPPLELCKAGTDCFSLTWVGDTLTGIQWIAGKLRAVSSASASPQQLAAATLLVERFLLTPEAEALGADQLTSLLGRGAGIPIDFFDAGLGTRVVAMPPKATGDVSLVIVAQRKALQESPAPRVVEQWVGARVVEAGGQRRLLVLGRSPYAALLVTYVWTDTGWDVILPLDAPVERQVGQRVQVTYVPGQTIPYRGIFAYGGAELAVTFTPDGKGVQFCEAQRTCLSYVFDNRWVLR